MTPVVAGAAAEIGHLHHGADHAHDAADVGPGACAEPFGSKAAATDPTKSAAGAAEAAALHHLAHHRSHGLHHRGKALLAHLGFHHVQHRRHLGHHVLTTGSRACAAKSAE